MYHFPKKLFRDAWSWLRIAFGMVFAPQRTLDRVRDKRDTVIAEVTRRGGRVEIAQLRSVLEASQETYTGAEREAYMRAVEDWISSLEAKYGTSIPFDESVKIQDELEALSRKGCP